MFKDSICRYSIIDDLICIYNKEIKNSNFLFGVSLVGKKSSVTSRLKASILFIWAMLQLIKVKKIMSGHKRITYITGETLLFPAYLSTII